MRLQNALSVTMAGLFQFLVIICAAVSLSAQAPLTSVAPAENEPTTETPKPLSQSVFLDVKDLGTNLASNENWRSVWGSYSKSVTRARGLEISLRNPAKVPGEYVVDWYFFATSVRGGKRFLFDRDSKAITLPPGGIQKATVISDTLKSHTTRYAYDYYYYNSSYKSGTKPEGWIVTVSVGGKVIRVKTSGAQLDELYKKTDEFMAMQQPTK